MSYRFIPFVDSFILSFSVKKTQGNCKEIVRICTVWLFQRRQSRWAVLPGAAWSCLVISLRPWTTTQWDWCSGSRMIPRNQFTLMTQEVQSNFKPYFKHSQGSKFMWGLLILLTTWFWFCSNSLLNCYFLFSHLRNEEMIVKSHFIFRKELSECPPLVRWRSARGKIPSLYSWPGPGCSRSFSEAVSQLSRVIIRVLSQGRAFFRGDNNPGRLVLDNISPGDEGLYKCRVDFAVAPTRISNILLDVIVPPEKPRIFDDIGKEVRLKLGPYRLGETVTISCEVSHGSNTICVVLQNSSLSNLWRENNRGSKLRARMRSCNLLLHY